MFDCDVFPIYFDEVKRQVLVGEKLKIFESVKWAHIWAQRQRRRNVLIAPSGLVMAGDSLADAHRKLHEAGLHEAFVEEVRKLFRGEL